jgi:antitoxin MazE
MRSALRKMGNSSGVIIPKPQLAELGLKVGDPVDIAVEDGRLVVAAVKRIPREGWAEASALIGMEEEPDHDWLDMPTESDDEWEW